MGSDILTIQGAHLREHIVERQRANVDAGPRPCKTAKTQSRIVDRFPGRFQQQALLWIQ